MGTLVEGGVLQGEENKEGGNTGRGWGKGRRAERVGTLVEDGERGGERRVGTLVEGGVLQGEENKEGRNTGRGWGKGRRAEGGDTGRRWGVARGGERRGWGHW